MLFLYCINLILFLLSELSIRINHEAMFFLLAIRSVKFTFQGGFYKVELQCALDSDEINQIIRIAVQRPPNDIFFVLCFYRFFDQISDTCRKCQGTKILWASLLQNVFEQIRV
jgi:hypothetical protein